MPTSTSTARASAPELISQLPSKPFHSVRDVLFADRALTCKLSTEAPDAVMESCTIATAHEAGWIWDIGLNGSRGLGCVYASSHQRRARCRDPAPTSARSKRRWRCAASLRGRLPAPALGQELRGHWPLGRFPGAASNRPASVLIEAAVGMLAEMLPHSGPMDAPARRFNELMTARYENIVNFLKLHYCLSQRPEPFWRDNAASSSIPERLAEFL